MSTNKINILRYENLNLDNLEYVFPQKTAFGMFMSNIYYRTKYNKTEPINIETPILTARTSIVKVNNKYYLEVELDIASNFYNFISTFDEKNVLNCHTNCREWFGQQFPYPVIEDFYKSPIKLKNKGKSPVLKINIPSYRGKILPEIYNIDRELIDPGYVDENDKIVCQIYCSGLKFYQQQFIFEWELIKLKVLKKTKQTFLPSGYTFNDINDIPTNIDNVARNNNM